MINTVENIRDWFLQCPAIDKVISFNADYLGETVNECAIYPLPTNLSYTEDVMGNLTLDAVQSLNFFFALRAPYGDDVTNNLENTKFFDDVKEWMHRQNTLKNLPVISEGETKYITPTQTEFISSANADTAMYQMRCELKYWRA